MKKFRVSCDHFANSFFSSFRNHSILFFLTLSLENKLIQKESGTLVLRCVYRVSNALGIDT